MRSEPDTNWWTTAKRVGILLVCATYGHDWVPKTDERFDFCMRCGLFQDPETHQKSPREEPEP